MGKIIEYPKEFKIKAVKTYLSGEAGGYRKVAEMFGMTDTKSLRRWVKQYEEKGEAAFEEPVIATKEFLVKSPKDVEEEILYLKAENEYLKRLLGLTAEKVKKKEKYQIILEMSKEYRLKNLFKISKITKSEYYRWISNKEKRKKKEQEEEKLIKAISELYWEHKARYGVLRMTEALKQEKSIRCNHKKVYRLMKENGYLSVIKRKKRYIKSGKPHPKRNVLKGNFDTSCPFDKMATDVTEIHMFDKKLYISAIKDLHTNVVEGAEMGESASLIMALKTFDKIKNKSIKEGTILHSDQGSLYNSLKYQKELEKNNFIQSMSRKGTPTDNAPMESFFSSLKSEVLYNPLIEIKSFEDLKRKVREYIEYYNTRRIQKGLGYLTPNEFKKRELEKLCG